MSDDKRVYFEPNVQPSGGKKSGAVILIVIAIALIAGAVAAGGFFIVKNLDKIKNFEPKLPQNKYSSFSEYGYSTGDGEVSADKLSGIDVDWVGGKILIEPYEGETVKLTETGAQSEEMKMRYIVANGKLSVKYCKSGFNLDINSAKTLTVNVPYGIVFKTVNIDCVGADVTVKDIKTSVFEVDTVSGNIAFSGEAEKIEMNTVSGNSEIYVKTLKKYEVDTVSGKNVLYLSSDISGFKVSFDSVSGNFENRFAEGSPKTYGDGSVEIDCDTMSGSLIIEGFSE